MPYLMLHDLRLRYFSLPLNQYRLAFDDGLFSQYYYYPLYGHHQEPLSYFIITSFIQPGPARPMYGGQEIAYLKPKKYMYRTFIENRRDHFMTTAEVQALAAKRNVRIGIHSHFHDVIPTGTHSSKRKPMSKWKLARFDNAADIAQKDLSIRSKIAFQGFNWHKGTLTRRTRSEWHDYIKNDTTRSIQWIQQHLGFTPDRYCFPFNEHNPEVVAILKSMGLKTFFAARPGQSKEVIGRTDVDALLKQSHSEVK